MCNSFTGGDDSVAVRLMPRTSFLAGVVHHVQSEARSGEMDASCVVRAVANVSSDFNITLKDEQKDAIVNFCEGQDVFVSLPTGFGKSMIYSLLPLVFDKIRGKLNYF